MGDMAINGGRFPAPAGQEPAARAILDEHPDANAGRSAGGRVLVAVPCFNEELAIGSLVVRACAHATEVLVVDDGSTDRTAATARRAGARVIVHPRNMGKGAGVRDAFVYARDNGFDALVLMDGDGQHDPDEIPALVAPVLAEAPARADVALGLRFGGNTEMPAWRRVGKRVLDYATAAGGAGVVTDSQCGYRAFGRRAIEALADRLEGDGFEIESEQLVHAREAGLTLTNVPIHCKYDGLDTSTKGPVAHALGVLEGIVDIVTKRHPLLALGLPSALAVSLALALGFTAYARGEDVTFARGVGVATLAILGALGILSALILNLVATLERRLERLLARNGGAAHDASARAA